MCKYLQSTPKTQMSKRPHLSLYECGLEFRVEQRWGIYHLYTRPDHKNLSCEDVSGFISLRGHVALRSYHAVSNLIWKVWRSLLLIQREICLLDEDQRILTPGWRKFRKSITERGSSLSRKQRDTLSGLRKRTACEIINKNRKCNRRVPKARARYPLNISLIFLRPLASE